MLNLLAPTPTTNDRNGNGKYKPLRRRRKQKKNEENSNEFKYLTTSELTMKFNNAKDPIYYAFEYLENRSLTQLMSDFIQDSIFEITNFVSRVVK